MATALNIEWILTRIKKTRLTFFEFHFSIFSINQSSRMIKRSFHTGNILGHMKQTDQTLLEQMRITELEISYRQDLLSFHEEDIKRLKLCRPLIESKIDVLVQKFYQQQTSIAEIALLIGDAGTLERLQKAQRRYVLDMFSGVYDLEYVNNRLRIGLVHKRIGVEPKLYLAAISSLKSLIENLIQDSIPDQKEALENINSLGKLFLFDITLVFETYIRSLVSEIQIAREKSEVYAKNLEEKVRQRTSQIDELMRTDALTGLLNVRYLSETLTIAIRAAQRRSEVVSLVFLDIDKFKKINDDQGHQRGDEILRTVGAAIKLVSRTDDFAFRYGGDEFCVILPNCRENLAREIYVSRLNAELNRHEPNLKISAGILQTGPDEYGEPDALIQEVDALMYKAKKMSSNASNP